MHRLIIPLLALCLACGWNAESALAQTVWYVDGNVSSSGNGMSWAQAKKTVEEGIGAALADQSPAHQVWVKAGLYHPPTASPQRYELESGVEVFGGFAGNENPSTFDPTVPGARDFVANETILSGDWDEDSDFSDNAAIVVLAPSSDDDYVFDGFTVRGAKVHAIKCTEFSNGTFRNLVVRDNQSTSSTEPLGAGMFIDVFSAPTVDSCFFTENHIVADGASGGAMNIGLNCDAVVRNCRFENNSIEPVANLAGGGGAVMVNGGVPVFRNCEFVENSATSCDGGAVNASGGGHETRFINCHFRDNRLTVDAIGDWRGGGLHLPGFVVINCSFIGNEIRTPGESLAGSGGGLSVGKETHLINCLFAHNAAAQGGGIHGAGVAAELINCTIAENTSDLTGGLALVPGGIVGSTLNMSNSILWGNVGSTGFSVQVQQLDVPTSNLSVTYSCIEDGTPGVTPFPFGGSTSFNIDLDPIFVAPLRRDFRLSTCSPCLDAANTNAVPTDNEDVDEDANSGEKTPDLTLLRRDRDEPTAADVGAGDPVVDMGSFEYHLLGNLHDPNDDELRDGRDIQPFTDCWMIHGPTIDTTPEGMCVLSDMDLDGDLDEDDVTCFVQVLLGGEGCEIDCKLGLSMPDCNDNGVWDATDIRLCDVDIDAGHCDCDADGILNECEIAECDSDPACGDTNENGIPDGCESDCNANGIPDEKDIADETSEDCNANDIPDECEMEFGDCDGNDVLDDCEEIDDCDEDLIPDACEDDCDGNEVPDDCELEENDCNENGYLDACDLELPPPFGSFDCNDNDIPDECDIAACDNDPACADCNENGVPDSCDIAAELSEDTNENGIPDECEQQMMMMGGFGSGEEEIDAEAWSEFYEWYFEQDFSQMSGSQRFSTIAGKLAQLGLAPNSF